MKFPRLSRHCDSVENINGLMFTWFVYIGKGGLVGVSINTNRQFCPLKPRAKALPHTQSYGSSMRWGESSPCLFWCSITFDMSEECKKIVLTHDCPRTYSVNHQPAYHSDDRPSEPRSRGQIYFYHYGKMFHVLISRG